MVYNKTGDLPIPATKPDVGIFNEDYTSEYSYDSNGNITSAYRQGKAYGSESDRSFDTIDDYIVNYKGNQKQSVEGGLNTDAVYYGSSAFVDGADKDVEYAYNANGSMTMDLNKGITDISYDNAGNLRKITFSGDREIKYVYAADGTRLRAVHAYKKGNALIMDSTDYAGNLVIRNGKPHMYMFPGGYYSFDGGRLGGCHYYIKDYLGSNRMVVDENGKTEQVTHYYPYGGIIGGIDSNPDAQPYKYEGKELDRTFGLDWYDIHARQYDPVIPSWHRFAWGAGAAISFGTLGILKMMDKWSTELP